jgi:predicted NBD/HSP70 family sugar kinase
MRDTTIATNGIIQGSSDLPSATVDDYNLEMRDREGGFVGDRASRRAFNEIIEDWRDRLRRIDSDPLGDRQIQEIPKGELDALLAKGEPEVAGLMHSAIEEFAQELAAVIRRFLRIKTWEGVERIVVGGGFSGSRMGELASGRATVLLKGAGQAIDLVPIRHHPDEAGLIGALQLLPAWAFAGHDAILAIDIGGSNIRAGIVRTRQKDAADFSKADVWKSELWRHAEEEVGREDVMKRLFKMLKTLIAKAEKGGLNLAPLIGVGCPGLIEQDGSISRGGQNLPGGNWEKKNFNLPRVIEEEFPEIGGHETAVVMHNDAVVQGLSQAPFMRDIRRWGVVTIGTGLGNAVFTNKIVEDRDREPKSK